MLQHTLFQYIRSDVVRAAGSNCFLLGSRATEVVSTLIFVVGIRAVVQLLAAVSTPGNTREYVRQTLSAGTALILAELLYPVKGILVNDRLMGVLKYSPLRRIVGNAFLRLVRLRMPTEVDHMAEVFLPA